MKLPITFEAVLDPHYTTVMVYCGDRRFRKAFEEFPQRVLELKSEEVFPICVPGGPTPLAHPNGMPSRCKALTKYLLFVCREIRTIYRVVLISHGGGCKYRCAVPSHCHHHEKERGELPLAGSAIRTALQNAPDLNSAYQVELYHNDFLPGGKLIGVERVEISEEILAVPQAWTKSYQPA